MKEKFQNFVSKIKTWQVILTFTAGLIALAGPWVIKIDDRYAKAAEEFQTNQQIQQSLHILSSRLDVKIAKDKYDSARQQKIEFELQYGTDQTVMTPAQRTLYINILQQYDDAKIEYDRAQGTGQ